MKNVDEKILVLINDTAHPPTVASISSNPGEGVLNNLPIKNIKDTGTNLASVSPN